MGYGWVWVGGFNTSPAGVPAVAPLRSVVWCDSTFVSATFVHRAQRTRHRPQSRRALCTHTIKNPARAGVVLNDSDLVEPGPPTCSSSSDNVTLE